MALTPDLKVDFKTDPEKRERRKKSAQELSNAFKSITGTSAGMQMQMPNSQAPDAMGLAKTAVTLFKLLSDKKLKKNIKTISNSMEILYG